MFSVLHNIIPFNFTGTLKAFARGRRTKNLYDDKISTEEAMDMKVEDLKKQFQLNEFGKDTKPTITDFLLFSAFEVFGLMYSILSIAILPFIVLYSIYFAIKKVS